MLRFITEHFDGVEHRVKNALSITYLWHLKIEPNSAVERLLSPQLKDTIKNIDTRLNSPNEKVDKFFKGLVDNGLPSPDS